MCVFFPHFALMYQCYYACLSFDMSFPGVPGLVAMATNSIRVVVQADSLRSGLSAQPFQSTGEYTARCGKVPVAGQGLF